MAGQEILILLSQLAHNFLVWVKASLVEEEERLGEYGTKRWVRDLLIVPGRVTFKAGQIVKVRISRQHSLMRRFFGGFARFFGKRGIRLILHET